MSRQLALAIAGLFFAGFLLFLSLWRLTLLPSEREDRAYLSHISVQERFRQMMTLPILPDHPLYLGKVLENKAVLWFTAPTHKLFTLATLGDDRLQSAHLLLVRGRKGLAVSTATKAEKYLLLAAQSYSQVCPSEKKKASVLMEQAIRRHVETLEAMKSQLSDSQQATIDSLITQLNQVRSTMKES